MDCSHEGRRDVQREVSPAEHWVCCEKVHSRLGGRKQFQRSVMSNLSGHHTLNTRRNPSPSFQLASQRTRTQREAGSRHRHRLYRHPIGPRTKQGGKPAHRVSTNAEHVSIANAIVSGQTSLRKHMYLIWWCSSAWARWNRAI
jgi:hypothetical protein